MADYSKPIAFCEHLQLSSLGVQPASISFQVKRLNTADVHLILMSFFCRCLLRYFTVEAGT